MAFSPSMMLADLDYIAPSQACVKPEIVRQQRAQAGEVGLPNIDEPIKITLQDCLACSGCVTTAETMLVTSQSRPQIEAVLAGTDENTPLPWCVVVSVSDQSAASIAAHLGIPMYEAFRLISGFARGVLGAGYVTDMRWAQLLSLDETAHELRRRLDGAGPLPLICSACPGWVCYAEKTHPWVLPHVCDVMSPQAIVGRYVKQCFAVRATTPPADVDPSAVTPSDLRARTYHISVQPCFDRKLEAARGDFAGEDYARDTDCVLGTQELLDWMNDVDATMPWRADLDSRLEPLRPAESAPSEATTLEGSGGYHQHLFARVAEARAGERAPLSALQYQQKRNANHRIATLPGLTAGDGSPIQFGVVYGFQHIQNLVRGLKRGSATLPKYAFIELMACPEGCLNGGGQARGTDRTQHYERLRAVAAAFEAFTAEASAQSPLGADAGPFTSVSAYRDWIGDETGSAAASATLRTVLHDRQAEAQLQDQVAASLRW